MKFLILFIISFLLFSVEQLAARQVAEGILIVEGRGGFLMSQRKSVRVLKLEDNVVILILAYADDYDFDTLIFTVVDNMATGYMLDPIGTDVEDEIAIGDIYDPETGIFITPPLSDEELEDERVSAITRERTYQNIYALELIYPSLYMASTIEDVLRESLRLEYVREQDQISESDLILQDEVGATLDSMRRTDYITFKALEDGTLLEDVDWLFTYDETAVLKASDIPDVPDK